jgi:predicted nucleic acid-binding protein
MDGVVVDTCVWIDIERGRLKPVDVADVIANAPVFLTPTILAELQYGVDRAGTARQRTLRAAALARLKRKPCLSMDADTGILFGSIAAELDGRGQPATHRLHDLWIAATAIQHAYALLTRNGSDFADIPGLKLVLI